MLHSLFPKFHRKFLSLPLLGPAADGFDDWLAANAYTRGSRRYSIRMLPQVDAELRRRHVKEIADLTHPVLHDYWKALIKVCPNGAGTVRTLGRYLAAQGLIVDGQAAAATATSSTLMLIGEYANYLREVRGFAASTVSSHRYTAQCFLKHLEEAGLTLKDVQPGHIESYIAKTGQRLKRASLQHDIGALRGLLRFLGHGRQGSRRLGAQIDTPRLYRLEQLPRALPWETVRVLLRSIDRTSAMGLRDYAMLLLIATYGLRSSEVVALTLEDIRWRQGCLAFDPQRRRARADSLCRRHRG